MSDERKWYQLMNFNRLSISIFDFDFGYFEVYMVINKSIAYLGTFGYYSFQSFQLVVKWYWFVEDIYSIININGHISIIKSMKSLWKWSPELSPPNSKLLKSPFSSKDDMNFEFDLSAWFFFRSCVCNEDPLFVLHLHTRNNYSLRFAEFSKSNPYL